MSISKIFPEKQFWVQTLPCMYVWAMSYPTRLVYPWLNYSCMLAHILRHREWSACPASLCGSCSFILIPWHEEVLHPTVICLAKLCFWAVLLLFLCICFPLTLRNGYCHPLLQVRKLWLISGHRTGEWARMMKITRDKKDTAFNLTKFPLGIALT